MSTEIRVRMAPAPTGRVHIGNARTALYNWLFARHHGGTFILRIEDTDLSRSSQEHVDEILAAFGWLGLNFDEGPDVDGGYGPYFQSQRLERYRAAADRILEDGKAYPCFCTSEELQARRRELERQGIPPRYDRRCRSLSQAERERLIAEGKPHATRFAVPDEGAVSWHDLIRGDISFENALLDDFVLVKSDGFPSYLLAVVVDDSAMRISHVIRGEDLISATPRQLHIYHALGLEVPIFAHLPLILGPDRSKLSKRHGPVAVTDYKAQGYLADALVNFLALLGWSPGNDRELLTRDEMIAEFSLEAIGKSGAVFDIEKLQWMNGVYLRKLQPDEYVSLAMPFLEGSGINLAGFDSAYVKQALLLEQERARTLADIPTLTSFFFQDPSSYDEKGERKWFRRDGAAEIIAHVVKALDMRRPFDPTAIEAALRSVGEQIGGAGPQIGAGPVIHTVRLAVTGRTAGPGLFELMAALGKDRVLQRLAAAEAHIKALQPAS